MPLVLCLGLPMASLAETVDLLPKAALDHQSVTAPLGGPIQLAPFKYIPPTGAGTSGKTPQTDITLPKRSPEQQKIVDLSAAGDYQAAGTEGLALIAKEKPDDALQLIIANSLAWTGRLKDATQTYSGLTKGKLANEANVGIANVQRWRGRDDLAAPIYSAVLASDPANADALEGLELAGRELSPRTMLSFGRSSDSSDEQRRYVTINHRWRDSSRMNLMEVETSGVRDALPNSQAEQQNVSLRYQSLNLALKPSLELSMPTKENRTLFGSVRIHLDENQASFEVGRVNWGRLATNPNALALGLAASHAGMTATQHLSFGKLLGRLNYYSISDGNTVMTGSLNVDSTWRPLGSNFKPFFGMEGRGAKFSTPNYWSPDQGSGTAYAGLMGEWGAADWNIYSSAQMSLPLFGEAGTGWSLLAGGKRWLSNDVALSVILWSMASHRDSAEYRSRSAIVNLEKLWK